MAIEMSTCGLIVIPRSDPRSWQTCLYEEEVTTPNGDEAPDHTVAIEFSQQRLKAEGLEIGEPDVELFTAAVHPGHVDRCTIITNADMAVDPDAEILAHPEKSIFTVCGIYRDNGQTYSGWWTANGPLMAYFAAWECARDNEGREFLVAGVHHGELTRYLPLTFAEPNCRSADEMLALMQELGVA